MKRILSLLTVITLTSSSVSTVISCDNTKSTNNTNPKNYDRSKLANKIKNKTVYIANDDPNYKLSYVYNRNLIINALKSQNPTITNQDTQYITIKDVSKQLVNDTFNDLVLNVNESNNKNINVTIKVIPYAKEKSNLYKALKEKITDNQIKIPNILDLKTKNIINTNNPKVQDFIKQTLRAQNSYLSTSDMDYIHIESNKTITDQPQQIQLDWYSNTSEGINSNITVQLSKTQDINDIIKDTKFDTYNNAEGKIFLNVYNHNTAIQPKIDSGVIKPASNLYNLLFGNIATNAGLGEKEQILNALNYDKITLNTNGANNDKDFLRNVEQSNEQQASKSSFDEYKTFMNKAFDNYSKNYTTLQKIQDDYNKYRDRNNYNLVNYFKTNMINKEGYDAITTMTNWIRLNTSIFNELFGKDLGSRLVGFFKKIGTEDSYEYTKDNATTRISLQDTSKDTYEDVKHNYDIGAHMDTSLGHVFTHEYGHAVNWGLMLRADFRKMLNNNSSYKGVTNPPLYKTPPQIYLLRYLDYVGHISSSNKNWTWLFANDLVNSTYGRSLREPSEPGQPELIAEAFAQWMYQPLEITNGAMTIKDNKLVYKNISKINAGWEVLNNFFLHVLPSVYNVIPSNNI